VQTNIVCFDISGLGVSADEFLLRLKANGVLALSMGKHKVRLVTHRGISREHVEKAVAVIEAVAKAASRNKKC